MTTEVIVSSASPLPAQIGIRVTNFVPAHGREVRLIDLDSMGCF